MPLIPIPGCQPWPLRRPAPAIAGANRPAALFPVQVEKKKVITMVHARNHNKYLSLNKIKNNVLNINK